MKYLTKLICAFTLFCLPVQALATRPLSRSDVAGITRAIFAYVNPQTMTLKQAQETLSGLQARGGYQPSAVAFTEYRPCAIKSYQAEECVGIKTVVGINGENFEVSRYAVLKIRVEELPPITARESLSLCYGAGCSLGELTGYHIVTPAKKDAFAFNTTYFSSEAIALENTSEFIFEVGVMVEQDNSSGLMFGVDRLKLLGWVETPIKPKKPRPPVKDQSAKKPHSDWGPKW